MPDTDTLLSKEIRDELGIYPELLQRLLVEKGLTTAEAADAFLQPEYDDLSNPFTLHDMQRAIERIEQAMTDGERIVIYADYDADGIPGAVILYEVLAELGHENIDIYIPHRHNEGYGFHVGALDKIASDDTPLVVTVDVGITDGETVAVARERGIDVIVTDHHVPSEDLPEAYAIVHPKLGDYADRMICGAAVAYQVARGLLAHFRERGHESLPVEGWEKWLLDLVGIATISDMVPLINENRIFAHYGMKVLQKSRRPGIQALYKKAFVQRATLTEDDIAFSVVPKINAASRMAHPKDAYDLLVAREAAKAQDLVTGLDNLNKKRKQTVALMMRESHKKLKARDVGKVAVVGDTTWNVGVVGLVASRLSEELDRPVFVWTEGEEGELRGSCRSDGRVSLLALMQELPEGMLLRAGGHDEAGGFATTREHIHHLEKHLSSAYDKLVSDEAYVSVSFEDQVSDALLLSDVTKETFDIVQRLAPFGMGNPKPLFVFRDCTIVDAKTFGKGREHLEIMIKDSSGVTRSAFAFYTTEQSYDTDISPGSVVTVYGHLDYSTYGGQGRMRIRMVHVQ